ncbi:RcpC/CpaB family pilus assembly protein [Vibrio agarivorans]|uniref:RcpC/CpaB family pilus assembly protein n=1 Tax=Vibrio agarivorans TaxID=153622 RepID=UPI002232B161|nr:RcpC/CpaB family pilus assembly protein [Vibrio agarivorans]
MKKTIIVATGFLALVFFAVGLKDKLDSMAIKEPGNVIVIQEDKVKYITMWRSKNNLSRGKPLTLDTVQKIELPEDEAATYGAKEDVILDFSPTTLLNLNVEQGDYILSEYQTTIDDEGYIDLQVSEGMALYPLEIKSNKLIRDYIRPGTYIDIITVSSSKENLAELTNRSKYFQGVKASIFLSKVKVIYIQSHEDKSSSNSQPRKNNGGELISVVVEVDPDEIANLTLAQRTMHIEIYRSQVYRRPVYAEVRNVIDNYTGIEELRGNTIQPKEVL